MLVSAFGRQAINALQPATVVAAITQLPAVRAEAITQFTLSRRHTRPRFVVVNSELLDYLACTDLGDAPRIPDGQLERPTKFA
jgi:hypothetical protein